MLRAMTYMLRGLEPALFEPLFQLDDEALAARGMRWMRVDEPTGHPCRISLEDAPVGERVLLLPFVHQDSRSPYRASGPIFVRRGIPAARCIVGELPLYLTRRPLSVRAYDVADRALPGTRRGRLPASALRAAWLLCLSRGSRALKLRVDESRHRHDHERGFRRRAQPAAVELFGAGGIELGRGALVIGPRLPRGTSARLIFPL